MFVVDSVPKIDSEVANCATFVVLLVTILVFLGQIFEFQDSVIETG